MSREIFYAREDGDAGSRANRRARTEAQLTLTKTLTGLALAMIVPPTAWAAEWRYCLAQSRAEHKVYLSTPFPTSAPMVITETAFDRMLVRSGLRHDAIQCPRSDNEQAALTVQQQAINFSRGSGNEVIRLPWRP